MRHGLDQQRFAAARYGSQYPAAHLVLAARQTFAKPISD